MTADHRHHRCSRLLQLLDERWMFVWVCVCVCVCVDVEE